MKIQVRYDNNRIDIFDTSAFTKAEPFDGTNMLTNFEVRVDELGNTGLWLMAHRYETAEAYQQQTDDNVTPTARRKRGWKFLLAEANELPSIESVIIDGERMPVRISGELVDMVRFEQMCELWHPSSAGLPISQRALALFDVLCRAFPELSADESAISRMCGFSSQAIDELRERASPLPEENADEDDDWLSEMNEGTVGYNI